MRGFHSVGLIILSLAGSLAASAAMAQTRVENINLVYTDPTVAETGKWIGSVNAEGWGVIIPSFRSKTSVNGGYVTEQGQGAEGGASISVGYDAFMLQLTGLGGNATGTESWANGAKDHLNANILEVEALGRYILPSLQFGGITPYIVGGYDYTQTDVTWHLVNNYHYISTGTQYLKQKNTYHTLFLGVGALYEFTPTIGLRFDVEGGPTFGQTQWTNEIVPQTYNDTLIGVMSHLTVYWKITDEITAQIGLKGAGIEGSNKVETAAFAGAFASIGYTFRF